MNNLISRQAAISHVDDVPYIKDHPNEGLLWKAWIESLPSAQPEQSSEIQNILEYLDTVLHPIVSPDHWNVYSELHDMISMLASAQPEIDKDFGECEDDLISRQAAIDALQGRK